MTTKLCSKCKVEQPIENFNRDRHQVDGRRFRCKACVKQDHITWREANRERERERAKADRRNNPEKFRRIVRKSELKIRYGLTPEKFDALKQEQKNCCAICLEEFSVGKQIDVDHIHGIFPTVVRGLLCSNCNNGLGRFKDSFFRLIRAASYIKKFS